MSLEVGGLRIVTLLLLLLLLAPSAQAQGKPRLRALLIGISEYRNPTWAQLPGCRLDIQTVYNFLTDPQGQVRAEPTRIRILPESESTRAGIEAALDQLVVEAQPGEVVYLHYSGHGSVVPSQSAGESDRLDECLVPIDAPDFRSKGYAAGVVRDKKVAAVLGALCHKVRQNGEKGSVILVFDSCHSGGLSRAAGQVRVRQAQGVREYFAGTRGGQLRRAGPTMEAAHPAGERGWVVLSACQYDQSARDTDRGGAFTLALMAALQDHRLKPGSSYYDLMQLVGTHELVNGVRQQQTPQSAGERELVIFGGSVKPHQPWISVQKVEGPVVTLDKGSLLGLTLNTEISIYPVGTAAPGGPPLAVASVTRADPLHAQATLKSTAGAADLLGAVAWVTAPGQDAEKVSLQFAPQLSAYPHIRKDVESRFPGQVKIVESDGDLVFFASDKENRAALTVERREGGTTFFRGDFSDAGLTGKLGEALTGELRSRYLLKIPESDEGSLKVSIVPGKLEGTRFVAGPPLPPGSPVAFKLGEAAQVEVENKGPTALYLSVFYVDSQGSTQALYPQPGGAAHWKALKNGDPPIKLPLTFSPPAGVDRIRVLGTREPIDIPFLLGGANRSAGGPPKAVELLMQSLLQGKRGAKLVVGPAAGFEISRPVPILVTP